MKQTLLAIKNFITREYKWIITILIAIPSVIVTYQNIKIDKKSESFSYIPPYYNGENLESLSSIDCWAGSIATNRQDAYRCSSGNSISDPCFQDPINLSVVSCPSWPDDKNLQYFKATINRDTRNNPEENPSTNHPWFIQMDDGSMCRILTGTSIVVAGKRFDYSCSGSKNISSLSLPIKQIDDKSYITCVIDNRIVENCLIKEAWY